MLNIRSVIVLGATAAALALGVSGAYANGPLFSPYEMLAPQPQQQLELTPSSEERASYVGGNQNCYPARVRIHGAWRKVQICD
jgi:hypothetical protein